MYPFRNFRNSTLTFLVCVAFASVSWAQDTNTADEVVEEVEVTDSQELDAEDVNVDDGSYLDADEEDFRPSEEIPADQAISFPTDI